MEAKLEEAKIILKKYQQEHLLNEICNLDFELVNSLYKKTERQETNKKDTIEPIGYLDKYKLNEKYKYYENLGKNAIREGKLAAVTMAGGQGTRLGHDGPKGTYDIGLESHKSLFELLCDYIKEQANKYNV